jgi:hypothetical protein
MRGPACNYLNHAINFFWIFKSLDKKTAMDKYDSIDIYCKKLGHRVPFKYCRTENSGIPCKEVLNCCFEKFDIEAFIQEHYSDEERQIIFTPSGDKISTLLELINQAKGRT